MEKPLVIAFTGRRGSGKSIATDYLCYKYGFVDVKFADPLKNMLRAMYTTCGLGAEEIEERLEGSLKEAPCEFLMGKTPRYAMQTIGTEWRELIDTELWSEMFKKRVSGGKFGDKIACSDYRFPHESALLNEFGATKIKIVRPSLTTADAAGQHSSETLIDTLDADVTIINDGTILELRQKVRIEVEKVTKEAGL